MKHWESSNGGCLLRRFALTAALCSIVMAHCPCVAALDPSLDVSQYAHTAWRVRDGFCKGQIVSIAQTSDGYLWLGTDSGLLRFDGVKNTPWQPPQDQHLPSTKVYKLLAARDGTLWIGTTKGLASWRSGKLTQYPDLAGQSIYALLEDREGTVWVGSSSIPSPGRLCGIRSSIARCYGQDGRFGQGVTDLYEDKAGQLWAETVAGMWRWKPGAPQFNPLDSTGSWRGIAQEDDGAILIAKNNGMKRLKDGKVEEYLPLGATQRIKAHGLLRDRDGGLWIGMIGRGILHVQKGRLDVLGPSDGLSGGFVNDFFEDREGNIWVATSDGLDRFRKFAVSTLTVKQGLSNSVIGSVLAADDGSVWLASVSGLDRWKSGKVTTYDKRDFKLDGMVPHSLFRDRLGQVWVSTRNGLGYLKNDRFVPVNAMPAGTIVSIAEDTVGDLWAANIDSGLIRVRQGSATQQIPWSELGHKASALSLIADHARGGLWLGFYEGGVVYFADGRVRSSYTAIDGLGEGMVKSLRIDSSGTLWASTEGGLSRLKDGRFATLNSKNGLPCDTVHWQTEDGDGSFWLYMPCGLVRIPRAEMESWADAVDKNKDAIRKIQSTVFDMSDGVRALSMAGNYTPQVVKTSDGKLWFLPGDGVSVLDPRHIPFNSIPPPVHIEQMVADSKTYDMDSNGNGDLRLPPHNRDLEIDYSALSFVVPEKNLFRYKLEGYDRDWQDVGNRRQAFYTNLPPRSYRFRVIACNNSGVWNETGDSFDFSIAPAYYQTTWFRLLCGASFLFGLWVLYQLRLQQLRHQFAIGMEARVNERTRLARELHDTLLQSFQGAVFQFQAARKLLLRNADNAMQVVDEAIQAAEEGITEGRAAIHDLRPEPAAQRDLPELLKATGRELADTYEWSESSRSFGVVVEGKQRNLAPMLQDEVYRISREVIRNAFAHAVASHIEVEIRYDQEQLRVRIRDDGKGIDPKILEDGGRSGHWGIAGMRERAQRIGARLDFWSEMGAGTEVQLTVPAAMAYEKRSHNRRLRLFHREGKQ